MIITILLMFVSFIAGAITTLFIRHKSNKELISYYEEKIEAMWHKAWTTGWESASNDFGHIASRYRELTKPK
jgi:hypothetical protein